jgi:MFS transporter, Spinster family, sphingosine-1-phosphate transporter
MIRDRRAILALLTALNLINYIDRAVIAAVLTPMKAQLGLTNLEAGVLNTAFLIGYFATSPLFGLRADKGTRKRMIALGVVTWSLATVASGLAVGFWSLLVARVVVGVGEASYLVLAPTIIDDVTPLDRKGSALSTFYVAIPVGYALGYILGGTIAHQWDAASSGGWPAGWQMAFFVVGGPGVVLALACLLIVEPPRKLLHARAKLLDGIRELVAIPLYRRAVLGYCAYVASVAGFSYWVVDFLLRAFPDELNVGTANQRLGGILLVSGIIGTMASARFANRASHSHVPRSDEPYDSPGNKRAVNALLRVCGVGMAVAAPLAMAGFLLPGSNAFFAVSFFVQIGLFSTTSPVNVAFMRAVPTERRASAVAMSIFASHLFGDLWSAALLGVLLDVLPLKVAMLSLPLTFAWTAYIWWPRKREASGPAAGAPGEPPELPPARVHTTT